MYSNIYEDCVVNPRRDRCPGISVGLFASLDCVACQRRPQTGIGRQYLRSIEGIPP